ncbi:MAG TPA: hypothetical protein VJ572_10425 [Azonexus sp.]|nr:hypothetical protein [Azonexus sp.]
MKNAIIAIALLGCSQSTWAARPFVTDDARLTTEGSCQLESWTRIYPDSEELWALPACNPTGNFELTLGAGLSRADGEPTTRDYVLQAKTLFKSLEVNGWGIGFALGKVYHPEITPGPNQLGNSYAYVPFSASFKDDHIVMHVNLGWLRDRASKEDSVTWGIGGEFRVSPRLAAIAETYGDHRSTPYGQVGLRIAVVPDLFQIDATAGRQFNGVGDNQWLSIGIRFTPERLF